MVIKVISRVVFALSFLLAAVLVVSGVVSPILGGLWFIWGILAMTIGISSCIMLSAAYKNTYLFYLPEHRGLWAFILAIIAFLGAFVFVFMSGWLTFIFLCLVLCAAYLVGRPFDITPASYS